MEVIIILLGWLLMATLVIGAVALGVFALLFYKAVTNPNQSIAPKPSSEDQMNQGDFHSGPAGYSPNTAYPDSFYGSGGSSAEDEFGGHNEGDFNR